MSLLQFLSILHARRGAASLILLITLAAALAWAVWRPERFSAQAPVMVDVQSDKVGGGFAPNLVSSYMATQIDIARSDRVVERALDLMQAGRAPISDPVTRAAHLRELRAHQSVRPARESNIILVGWSAPTAAAAAQGANENCVAHNGSLIPVPGRDIMAQAWYQGGLSVFDFTNPAKPVEIAYFDRGPSPNSSPSPAIGAPTGTMATSSGRRSAAASTSSRCSQANSSRRTKSTRPNW